MKKKAIRSIVFILLSSILFVAGCGRNLRNSPSFNSDYQIYDAMPFSKECRIISSSESGSRHFYTDSERQIDLDNAFNKHFKESYSNCSSICSPFIKDKKYFYPMACGNSRDSSNNYIFSYYESDTNQIIDFYQTSLIELLEKANYSNTDHPDNFYPMFRLGTSDYFNIDIVFDFNYYGDYQSSVLGTFEFIVDIQTADLLYFGKTIDQEFDKDEECYKLTGCRIVKDSPYSSIQLSNGNEIKIDDFYMLDNSDYYSYIASTIYDVMSIHPVWCGGNKIYIVVSGYRLHEVRCIWGCSSGIEYLPICVFLFDKETQRSTYYGHSIDGTRFLGMI